MKFILPLLIAFTASFSTAQRPLKDVYLKRTLKQGGLQYEFKVLDEDKHGVWFYDKEKFYFWYKAQGVKSTQGESSGTLLHGDFESFYDNDQLHQKGSFKRGLKCGEWLHWREDGSLIYTEIWSKGQLKVKKWYNNTGRVYRSERDHGRNWKKDKADTVIITRKLFKTERRIYRDANGTLSKVENVKHGALHGKSMFYSDGKLERTERYRNGELMSSSDDVKEPKEEKPKREKKERKKKNKEEE